MNSSATLSTATEASKAAPGRAMLQGLWQRYHQEDASAEGDLVEQYLPLVKHVVGRLAMNLPSHASVDDLQSAGLVGLLQSLRSYDPAAGASFETYARIRIRGAVFDELRRMDWVPRLVHDKARKVQTAIGEFEQRVGRSPTEVETAQALGLSLAEYEKWMEQIRPATFICLDSASHEDESGTLHDAFADDTQQSPMASTELSELKELIFQKISNLPEIQRKVLALYYFEDLRLREIAEVFSLTESRISQIHSQAILTIRASIEREEAEALRTSGIELR